MMRVSFLRHSSLSFPIMRWEMNSTFDSECVRMFVTSFSDTSASIGTTMRPYAVAAKKATTQLGMFWDRMATRSPCLMPKRDMRCESRSTLVRNSA